MANAGARVLVTNHKLDKAEAIAENIRRDGGLAEAAQVNSLDKKAVQAHLDEAVRKFGSIDISFNLTGYEVLQDVPLINMLVDDFIKPISTAMQTNFITATEAGKIMTKQKSGVVITLTATPGGIGYPGVGGFGPICAGIETFARNLATELGPSGVRVVNIRSAGSPDSRPFKEALDMGGPVIDDVIRKMKSDTMLKTLPAMKDIAAIAVFLSSEMASKITGTTIDVTIGTTGALNHRTG
jgi:NAD(P)-dependent dehydrogenase (short-subunit alcohol dehydrogenase family)